MYKCVIAPSNEGEIRKQLRWGVMNKATEILFQCAIENFSLPIGFGVIGSTHAQLCARNGEKFTPKTSDEDRVAVQNQTSGKTMKLSHDVEEECCDLVC